jgi:hypothetical protein
MFVTKVLELTAFTPIPVNRYNFLKKYNRCTLPYAVSSVTAKGAADVSRT